LKLMAENILTDEMPESLIVRMAGFFGGREVDKNFVGKITLHMAEIMKEGINYIEIGDRVWQPTFTNDLAYNSLVLLSNNNKGVYCMSSHGKASFFELASLIVSSLGISERMKIHKVSSLSVSKNERAKRPEVADIENKRLKSENLDRQRSWQVSLVEYLNHPYFTNLIQ